MKPALPFLAALLLAVPLAAQTPPTAITVAATPAVNEVTAGQSFTLQVQASGPAGTAWTFPEHPGNEKVELELLPPTPNVPTRPGTATYRGAAFALGEAEIPAITVQYRLPDGSQGTAASPPSQLRIGSVLPKSEENPAPADLRPPVKLPFGMAFWVALAVSGALVATLVWALLRRRRRAGGAVEAPPVPEVAPDAEALAALDRLAASGRLAREEFRAFYIELAGVAKRYLERRLGEPVLEMTSAEVSALLRDHPVASEHHGLMREVLGAADWVKFAHGATRAETAGRHLDAVRTLVASVEARTRLQAAAPAEEVAA